MKPENLLFIDIETVPVFKSYRELNDSMKPLWEKKSNMISPKDTLPEDSFKERAGIFSEFGKIICVSLGYIKLVSGEHQIHIKTIKSHNENEILIELAGIFSRFFNHPRHLFCGHNIREFDIPYICRRMYINQIKLPKILLDLQHAKPWENPMLDTLQFWKFGEYKHFTSIDLLANVLGIESPKQDIDGSMVAEVYWQQNDLDRIARYCSQDVLTVAQVYMRLHELPLIKKEHVVYL